LAASVPGTLHLPPGRLFTQWAGSLLPYSAPIILIAENESQIETAVRDLAIIGLDNVAGWFGAEALADAARHGLKLIAIPQASVEDLFANGAERDTLILDVRGENEWRAGHIPGAVHIPLGDLPERAGDLPSDRPIAVHCQGGGRSPIGVSLLRRQGFERVLNLRGGYYAYKAAGLPIATSSATEDAATEPNRV
jgi:hydroxyacylglutathione hydrolase